MQTFWIDFIRGCSWGAVWLAAFCFCVGPVPIHRIEVVLAFSVCPGMAIVVSQAGRRHLSELARLSISVPLLGIAVLLIVSTRSTPSGVLMAVSTLLSVVAALWLATAVADSLPRIRSPWLLKPVNCLLVFVTSGLIISLSACASAPSAVDLYFALRALALPFSILGMAIAPPRPNFKI
jgi:hypothetical protein